MTQAPLAKPHSKQAADSQPHQAEGGVVAIPKKTKPVTLRTIAKMAKQGEKFPCLTCYDATTAKWLERSGIPILLVGDTAAEMILGLPSTIHAPLDFLITINAAVKRGAPNTLVMADMPFMSYQADEAEGIRNAGRFMTEGLADAVKVEVDRSFTGLVKKMARAGVPVVAHIGSLPQRAKMQGGYRSVGRTAKQAQAVVDDALALEEAGAIMLLLEACPNEVSSKIVEETSIPVIGCGAGPACHGQIVVLHDLLGLTDWQPAFARPITALGKQIILAADQWIDMVKTSKLGEHPYKMAEGELAKFNKLGKNHSSGAPEG
ncbi:MAG: 3-methyl-2-oxobutanoate hydroxymethyltransferase [Planctomycetes bacterium]|nr:3-methyl-2-oxobutanoate hydroxymethyltransferase [Planctomycetota bacterium]